MFIDYEIAVVGAGITGASIAAKLCSAGVSVALIDKGAAGSLGASGYSGGLVRLYDSDPLLMELAAYSIGLIDDGIFAGTYARALTRTGVIYRAAADQLGTVCRAIEQYGNARYPM
ncbi:oxidoreductase, FAD-binding protein, partial [Pseudomonas syringae pv. actinidiae ICMP 19096]